VIVIGKPETISQQLREAAAYAEHGFYHPQETFGPQDVFAGRDDYSPTVSKDAMK